MTATARLQAAVAAMVVAGASAQACPPAAVDGRKLDADGVVAAWRVADAGEDPPGIVVSRHFALLLHLCPAGAELLAVDATMPAHRHGMNYRPSLTPLGDGRWRAEGLLFHMAGAWELRLDVRHGGRTVVLRQAVELP